MVKVVDVILYGKGCFVCSLRYFSSLILVEGMDIDFLHKCALEDCTDQHQLYSTPEVTKVGLQSAALTIVLSLVLHPKHTE